MAKSVMWTFVMDDQAWAIRYLDVATRNWWPGKKVLVSPEWVKRVSWAASTVFVGVTRDAVQNAPEYTEAMPITRTYEDELYLHYGRPPYWLREAQHESSLSMSGA